MLLIISKHCQISDYELLPTFSSKSLVVLALKFWSLTYFELFFICNVRYIQFAPFCVNISCPITTC